MSELKNQELPLLELTQEERTKAEGMGKAILESGAPLDCIESYVLHVYARERQLSAALNELKAKDTELAAALTGQPLVDGTWPHLPHCNGSRNYPAGTPDITCCCHPLDPRANTELAAKDARIAEQMRRDLEAVTNCEKLRVARTTRKHWQDRAEAAEKSLGAVSGVLDDHYDINAPWEKVKRIRSIVKGK